MRWFVMETLILTEKCILNSEFRIILPIMRIKKNVEIVYSFFLKMADSSHLAKIVLIMHNKYSQTYIVHKAKRLT